MKVIPSRIRGCYLIEPFHAADERGSFTKIYQASVFQHEGLAVDVREEYYSVSRRGVLRGLHFQTPPHDHVKLVHCVHGACLDVVVDLRTGSPTYGQHETFTLDASQPTMVYIPRGLAHGFFTLSDDAILLYRTSTEHVPSHDLGIRWDSAGIAWPSERPLLSDRDQSFPTLDSLISPFRDED